MSRPKPFLSPILVCQTGHPTSILYAATMQAGGSNANFLYYRGWAEDTMKGARLWRLLLAAAHLPHWRTQQPTLSIPISSTRDHYYAYHHMLPNHHTMGRVCCLALQCYQPFPFLPRHGHATLRWRRLKRLLLPSTYLAAN